MIRLIRLLPLVIFFLSACGGKNGSTSTGEASVDPATAESIVRGEAVYKQYCIACHMKDGGGAPPMNPPLINTSFVKGDKTVLINVVLKGMSGQPVDGQKYHNVMPPLDFLTDEQVADVLTYVRNSFGNVGTSVSSEEVNSLRVK